MCEKEDLPYICVMDYRIHFDKEESYNVALRLPASKSISNRVLIINALSERKSRILNPAICDDTDAIAGALARFEACRDLEVNVNAAGTAMRFLTAYFASQPGCRVSIDGTERLRHRPISELVDALHSLGADIAYADYENQGHLPILIHGKKLSGKTVSIKGNVSSQYISALMMIAPYIAGGLTIDVTGEVVSMPYIEMTERLMTAFGADVRIVCNENKMTVDVSDKPYGDFEYKVESDWSAASYWYEIKSLIPNMNIELLGLKRESLQGDSRVVEYFDRYFGVTTVFTDRGVLLKSKSIETKSLSIDLSGEPDLTPTIAVTACLLGTPFKITGLATLTAKESDRIDALQSQLRKLGYDVTNCGNCALQWSGERADVSDNIIIETFDDHRMAMAFAPVAIKFQDITVENVDVVKKSYPLFWEHLKSVGFKLYDK